MAFILTYDLKRDILTHVGPKKGDLGDIELIRKGWYRMHVVSIYYKDHYNPVYN